MDREAEESGLTQDDGLEIVLTVAYDDLGRDVTDAQEGVREARRQAGELKDLERRVRATGPGTAAHGSSQREGHGATPRSPSRARRDRGRTESWDELRAAAEKRLRERGIDPTMIDIDDLLDPVEVKRIEHRFDGGFRIEADLDRYDVIAAVGAGLTAALVDFLLVRIPKDTLYRGAGLRDQFKDRGSPLTKWMHEDPLPHDHPLSRICKTPFDRVNLKPSGRRLVGSGGTTHRHHALGHDPLFGLVFGTIDVMRGGLTGIDRNGRLVAIGGISAGQSNPFIALLIEIGHLLSDGSTQMGLPPPGWNLAPLLQFGRLGPHDQSVSDTARDMYRHGYDSRHFLTMATAPAAGELVLRGYWGIRNMVDEDFNEAVAHAARIAQATRLADHPRFQAMSLVTHLIASAANAGKIAVYQNPLALNYAQWLMFIRAILAFSGTQFRSPSDVLVGRAEANLAAIGEAWPEVEWADSAPVAGGQEVIDLDHSDSSG